MRHARAHASTLVPLLPKAQGVGVGVGCTAPRRCHPSSLPAAHSGVTACTLHADGGHLARRAFILDARDGAARGDQGDGPLPHPDLLRHLHQRLRLPDTLRPRSGHSVRSTCLPYLPALPALTCPWRPDATSRALRPPVVTARAARDAWRHSPPLRRCAVASSHG